MAFFDPPGEQRRAPECIFQTILRFFAPKFGIKESNSHGKKAFFVPMWDQRTVWEGKKGKQFPNQTRRQPLIGENPFLTAHYSFYVSRFRYHGRPRDSQRLPFSSGMLGRGDLSCNTLRPDAWVEILLDSTRRPSVEAASPFLSIVTIDPWWSIQPARQSTRQPPGCHNMGSLQFRNAAARCCSIATLVR